MITHTVENDLPSQSARELEQKAIDLAIAEFLANGHQIVDVDRSVPRPKSFVSDEDLVKQLVIQASKAMTLAEAANVLNVPEDRCRRLAVKHRIPFRSKSFINKRRAAK